MASTRSAALALLAALAGCSSPAPAPADSRAARRAVADGLAARLTQQGYAVDEGSLAVFRPADCAALPTCYAANPTSPYVVYHLPLAPGEVASDARTTPFPPWRMNADEAVVLLLRTPPRARYFSFRSYLFERPPRALFASLGDALNPLTIATSRTPDGAAGDASDAETIVVTTGDRALDALVRRLAVEAGAAPGIANTDVVAPSLVHLGLDASADTLLMLGRVAAFADEAAGEAWLDDVPGILLRVRPTAPRAVDPFRVPAIRTPGTGTTEAAWAPALDRLGDALRAAHPTLVATSVPVTPSTDYGFSCIASDTPCSGEVRDALYSVSDSTPLGADDLVVIYGVDHHATGKATYTSVTPYDDARNVGVRSALDTDFAGSAAAWLPAGDPAGEALYAYTFARRCDGRPYCAEVGTAFPGVALDGRLYLIERAYLEAATRTMPAPGEVEAPRVVRFHAP